MRSAVNRLKVAFLVITLALAPGLSAFGQSIDPIGRGGLVIPSNGISPVATLDFVAQNYTGGCSGGFSSCIAFSTSGGNSVVRTQYDSTGKLTYAPNNLLPYNQQIVGGVGNWVVSGGATVTWNQGASPVTGANVVSKIVADGSTINQGAYANAVSVAGRREIFAVWLKGAVGGEEVQIGDATSRYNVTLTTSWALYYNPAHAAISDSPVVYAKNNTAMTFYVSDAYLSAVTYETAPRAADQVITTSAAYYGPRFDYDPATLAAKGLLIEEPRTNLISYSNAFTSGSWVDSGVAPAQTGATDPTGGANSWTLTASGAGASLYFPYTTVNGLTYTNSIWMRRRAGTGTITLRYPNNTNLDVTSSVTNSWARVNATSSVASTTGFLLVQLGTAGDKIDVFGAQAELGSFATSYIPTGASSVTRAADVVQLTGTVLTALQGAQGAAFVETGEVGQTINAVSLSADPPTKYAIYYHGTTTPWAVANYNGSIALDGATKASLQSAIRAGVRWSASGRAVVTSGGTITGDANTLSLSGGIWIGSYAGVSNYLNGHVRSVGVFNQSLPDAQFKANSVIGASFATNDNFPRYAANENLPILNRRFAL